MKNFIVISSSIQQTAPVVTQITPMKMTPQLPLVRRFSVGMSIAATLLLMASVDLSAQTVNWNTAGTGNWTDTTRWTPNGTPGSGNDVNFNASGVNGNEIIYLNGNQAAQSITISNTGTTTLTGGVAGTLANQTLSLGSGGLVITSTSGNVTFGNNATSGLVAITGSSGITKNSTGTLTLYGNSTYSGGTVINGGTLTIGGSSSNSGATVTGGATGTGNVTFNNSATVTSTATGNTWLVPTLTLNGNLTIGGTQRFKLGYSTLDLGSGTRTLNLTNTAGNHTVTGGNTITSESTGQYALETQNNLAATGTIQNGTLNIQAPGYSGTNYNMILLGLMSYTNADVIVGSNVILGLSNNQLSARITVQSGGILNLTNVSRSIGLLAGGGNVFNSMVSTGTVNATLTVNAASGTEEFSGVLSNGPAGTLALTKAAGSTQILSGTNTYTGNTTITGGTLQIGNGTTTGSLSTSSIISIGTGATLAFNRSNTVAQGIDFYSGNITGLGGIVQNGAGTLTLNAANAFTGGVAINAGILQVGSAGALNSTAGSENAVSFGASSTGILQLNGNSVVIRSLNSNATVGSPVVENASASTATLTIGNSGNQGGTFAGVVQDGSGGGALSLTKTGTGTLTLSGTSANTFTGTTLVAGGVLALNKTAGVNAIAGNITLGDASGSDQLLLNASNQIADTSILTLVGTVANTRGDFRLNGFNETIGGLAGAGVVQNMSNSTVSTLTLNLATGITQTSTTLIRNNDGTTANGTLSLVKSGAGTQVLSGANTYTSGTSINAGVLKVGSATALGGNASAVTVADGAVLDLNGTTMTAVNALTLNGTGISSGGALTNTSGTAGTFAGLITLGGSSSIIASGGNITLSNVGTITGAGFGLTVGGAANTTIASIIGTGSGSLTKQDAGKLMLSGNNTYTGSTTINAGTVQVGVSSNYTTTSGAFGDPNNAVVTLGNGVSLVAATGYSVAAQTYNLGGDITVSDPTLVGRLSFSGTWDLGGASRTITLGKASGNYTAGNEVMQFEKISGAGGNATVQNAGSGGALVFASAASANASNPSIVAVNSTPMSFASNTGLTLGDGVAMKSRTGTFFATGTNAPALTLAADSGKGGGVLQMGDGITGNTTSVMRSAEIYSLSGGGVVTASNTTGNVTTGTLTINNGNGANFSGTITDGGGTGKIAVTKSGNGTQIFSGTGSYTGNTTISAGTLIINGNFSGATGAVTVASGATLGGNGTIGGATTVSGNLSPGNSPGLLVFNSSLTLGANSTTTMEISGTGRGTTYDAVDVGASQLLTYGGTLTLSMSAGVTNGTYNLFSFTSGSNTGNFSAIAFDGGYYSGTWSRNVDLWTSSLTQGQIFTFNQANGDLVAAVPEPSTWVLLGLGVGALTLWHRRGRKD